MQGKTKFGLKTQGAAEKAEIHEARDLPSKIESMGFALSVEQLAKLTGLSDWAIRKQIKKRKLVTYRIGDAIRIDPLHAAQWLRATSTLSS